MSRKHWLTTHWPPRRDEPKGHVAPGVWLAEGREQVGDLLRPGDLVFVYETRGGKTVVESLVGGEERRIARQQGQGAIIALGEATDRFHKLSDSAPEQYADQTEIWWRWFAPLEIRTRSGRVPREEVLRLLGYRPNYALRGFGGLKQLTELEGGRLAQRLPVKRFDPPCVLQFSTGLG